MDNYRIIQIFIFTISSKEGGFIILTIARKSGEYIVIGEDIFVKVISDNDGELQLEIDAPSGIDIMPGEMSNDAYYAAPPQFANAVGHQSVKSPGIDKIAVWKENSIVLIDPLTILYFTVDKKRVIVHTEDDTFESNFSLEYLEERLFNRGFFRCHKSFVINLEHVDKIVPWFNSTFMMKLKVKSEQIPVSRHYTKRLRSLLNI